MLKRIIVKKPLNENVISIPQNKLVNISKGCIKTENGENFSDILIDTRNSVNSSNELNHKSLWLNPRYRWIIGEDSEGVMILVPVKND